MITVIAMIIKIVHFPIFLISFGRSPATVRELRWQCIWHLYRPRCFCIEAGML